MSFKQRQVRGGGRFSTQDGSALQNPSWLELFLSASVGGGVQGGGRFTPAIPLVQGLVFLPISLW